MAFLHAGLIAEITKILKATNSQREQMAQLVSCLEAKFIADTSDSNREAWTSAQGALDSITESKAERKRFF